MTRSQARIPVVSRQLVTPITLYNNCRPEHAFCERISKVSATDGRRHICNVLSHWPRSCLAIDRNFSNSRDMYVYLLTALNISYRHHCLTASTVEFVTYQTLKLIQVACFRIPFMRIKLFWYDYFYMNLLSCVTSALLNFLIDQIWQPMFPFWQSSKMKL